jgi:hypothetical protein
MLLLRQLVLSFQYSLIYSLMYDTVKTDGRTEKWTDRLRGGWKHTMYQIRSYNRLET